MWGYPLLPALYIVCLIAIALSVLVQEPQLPLTGLVCW